MKKVNAVCNVCQEVFEGTRDGIIEAWSAHNDSKHKAKLQSAKGCTLSVKG